MTSIHNATDADLRQLVFKKDHVIVKFIDEECKICKALAPSFESLALLPKYKEVLFLRMDAKVNPVSSKEVKFSSSPFIATYKKGILLDCGVVTDIQGITEMLDRLLV
ncbi:thioredoxin [Pontibacter sp. KCTC 32443]|uniref:protein disulfide isomerase family protein n=1 Tax=Pontibacter TaxID=323449 RepID=UPI00164D1FEC|nr:MULTISPECIES: protein disulfide isomerase family protein [Pontibacter]MBC5772680.1 thioredoxin [Pontibacter sp. KCTC 32443]